MQSFGHKIWCHCLYHASTRNWLMVTHMQLAYTSPATHSEMLILLGGHINDTIHALLQADMSRPSRYHKPPTQLQFYYLFEICKVELSSVCLYDLWGGMIVPHRKRTLNLSKQWPISRAGVIISSDSNCHFVLPLGKLEESTPSIVGLCFKHEKSLSFIKVVKFHQSMALFFC